jgi:hypothetical protein
MRSAFLSDSNSSRHLFISDKTMPNQHIHASCGSPLEGDVNPTSYFVTVPRRGLPEWFFPVKMQVVAYICPKCHQLHFYSENQQQANG